jgi:hypothetical protein
MPSVFKWSSATRTDESARVCSKQRDPVPRPAPGMRYCHDDDARVGRDNVNDAARS